MSSGLVNNVTVNLENGETISYNQFICFNLEVKPIDKENEEIHMTKYVSTNLDIQQNQYANMCVAKTCESIMTELIEHMNSIEDEMIEEVKDYKVGFLDCKNITLKGADLISVIRMGICFGVEFTDEEDVKITVHPTSSINTIAKIIYTFEIFANNINESIRKYEETLNGEGRKINIELKNKEEISQ